MSALMAGMPAPWTIEFGFPQCKGTCIRNIPEHRVASPHCGRHRSASDRTLQPAGLRLRPVEGSLPQVELQFRSLGAAEALLMFGTDAEVLSPPELRQNLARKAAQAAAAYAASGH